MVCGLGFLLCLCQLLLIPFFRIQIRKPDQEPAAHEQYQRPHPGFLRQGLRLFKGCGHFALVGIVAASGQHMEHVLSSRQRGIMHFMVLFAFHVNQFGVVTFHVVIQVAVHIGKGQDAKGNIQLAEILRNNNFLIIGRIGHAAVRHPDLDAVNHGPGLCASFPVLQLIQGQHIPGTGKVQLLFFRRIVMAGAHSEGRIQRIIIGNGMVGLHPFVLFHLRIHQLCYIHALGHL